MFFSSFLSPPWLLNFPNKNNVSFFVCFRHWRSAHVDTDSRAVFPVFLQSGIVKEYRTC